MDAAFSPLRQMGIRILNYLDDWFILAQSEAVSTSHKTLLHLSCLGLRVNFAKSILSPSQRVLFLGTVIDSVLMRATVSVKQAMMIQRHTAPPARVLENLGSLWQSSSRPLRLRRQFSLPNLFHEEHGCPGPLVAQSPARCFPSNCSATASTQTSQGAMAQAYSNSPPWEQSAMGVGAIPAARSSPVANPLETGPTLSSEWHAMASKARVMGPAYVATQWEPFDLPERVLSTMAEARSLSTRCLYDLK